VSRLQEQIESLNARLTERALEHRHDERTIRAYQRRLQRLASELSLSEARERREIASDLHDHIGQSLAYIRMKLTRLQGNSVFCGFEGDFSEVVALLDQTIQYTRDLTVEISPPVLYELGLGPALVWLGDQARQRHGFKVSTKLSGKPRTIADDTQIVLFKSSQELLNNVAKHAEADQVEIGTLWTDEGIEVNVDDNGKGFEVESIESRTGEHDGFGLFSIRERLSYIGGWLKIDSVPGAGTRARLFAPYQPGEQTREH
jgi:signal transduction histidine kinase